MLMAACRFERGSVSSAKVRNFRILPNELVVRIECLIRVTLGDEHAKLADGMDERFFGCVDFRGKKLYVQRGKTEGKNDLIGWSALQEIVRKNLEGLVWLAGTIEQQRQMVRGYPG